MLKIRESGPPAETLVRVAMENSCDVLVAGLGDGKPVFGECLAMYSARKYCCNAFLGGLGSVLG